MTALQQLAPYGDQMVKALCKGNSHSPINARTSARRQADGGRFVIGTPSSEILLDGTPMAGETRQMNQQIAVAPCSLPASPVDSPSRLTVISSDDVMRTHGTWR